MASGGVGRKPVLIKKKTFSRWVTDFEADCLDEYLKRIRKDKVK